MKEVNAELQTENKWFKSELNAVYKGVKNFVQENFKNVKEAINQYKRFNSKSKNQKFTTTFEKNNNADIVKQNVKNKDNELHY